MLHIKDGRLRPVSGFQYIVVLLLLNHVHGGQSQETGPPQPVVAMLGEVAILPCQLEPPMNAVSMTMEWGRLDLDPRFVFVWHDGQELLGDQNQAYKGRASVSINNLTLGDFSLRLSSVKTSDSGTYRCYFPKLNKEYLVELLVGAASSPAISLAGLHESTSAVMLDCRSGGWSPEPEVSWLDAEGNLLSAGPAETVRGPDDLYTVSSRVTVEKRPSSSFTCRVQQKDTNQTRETHIYVPEDFFVSPSRCSAAVAMSVMFGLMFVLTVVVFVWKWRQNQIESKKQPKNKTKEAEKTPGFNNAGEQQGLMEAGGSREERLMEEIRKIEEESQKKDKDMTQLIDTLTELGQELKKQKEELNDQENKAETQSKENKEKVKSVEKEVSEKEGDKTAKKVQGYSKLKEIIAQNSWNLQERKKEFQQLGLNTDRLMKRIYDINIIKENLKEGQHTKQLDKTEDI